MVSEQNLPLAQGSVLNALKDVAKSDITATPIGTILEAAISQSGHLWILFSVDASKYEGVVWLMEHGYTRGLSLTHVLENNVIVPLEVSICSEPARPCCYIHFYSFDQKQAQEYIRGLEYGPFKDPVDVSLAKMTDATVPEGAKPLIEQALDQLPEEGRKLIQARLSEMVKHVDDARAETKKATEDREKAVKEAEEARTAAKEGEVNVGMLKSQLDILRGNLGEDLIQNYAITESQCKPNLESQNPNAILRLFDRVLCAANMRIMMSQTPKPVAASAPRPRTTQKRKIEEVTPEETDNSPEAILDRAMANTFEVY